MKPQQGKSRFGRINLLHHQMVPAGTNAIGHRPDKTVYSLAVKCDRVYELLVNRQREMENILL
jgi:hypothetical protein